MKKRVLSVLLCMALCLGLLPGTARAAELTVTTGTVAAGSYALSGDLTATGDITLANGVTIDGGGKTINIGSHILSVEGNGAVTLRNAKISTTNHASNNAYGAIRVLAANVSNANAYSGGGTLILDNCSITCDTKTERLAIEIVNSSTLYANNVKIENCGSAISDSAQNNSAGATAYLSNCTITGNSSGVSWSNSNSKLYATNCVFTDNTNSNLSIAQSATATLTDCYYTGTTSGTITGASVTSADDIGYSPNPTANSLTAYAADAASLKAMLDSSSVGTVRVMNNISLAAGTYGPASGSKTVDLNGAHQLTIASGTTVTLKNMTIQAGENYSNASTKLNNAGTLKLENVNVVGAGKGLMNTGTAVLTGCCFYNNNSNAKVSAVGGSSIDYSNYGGAVCSNNKLILDGCSFTGNTSNGYGGAFGVIGGSAYVNNCVFSDNAANGQACYVISGGSIYMMNSTALKTTEKTDVVDIRGTFEATNNIFIGTFWGTGTRNYEVTSEECLNSTTPTQKGYGYYYPVKESSNATTAGVYATYFNYTDPTSVKMGYKATVSAEITYLVGTNGLAESDKVETYYEGGTRVANYVGASGLPYPTVTFNSNGGSAVESQQMTTDVAKVLEPENPERPGYTFEGWYTDNSTFSNSYTFGNHASKSITLYAKWTVDPDLKQVVTFKANYDDGGADHTQDVPRGIATPLVPNTFHRDGWTFTGWNTMTDGTGDNYADGAGITVSGDTTLYAQWTDLQDTAYYTVTDKPNRVITLKTGTNQQPLLTNFTKALKSSAQTIIVPAAVALTATGGINSDGVYDGMGKTVRVATPYVAEGEGLPSAANNSPSNYRVFTVAANVTIKNMTIIGGDGGAIEQTADTLTMENVTMERSRYGLQTSGGSAVLRNCTFRRCFTSDIGGALYVGNNGAKVTVVLDGCSFTYNNSTSSANSHGGSAIWIYGGSSTVYANNCVFAGNKAIYGGAVRPYNSANIYLMNCTIARNMTTKSLTNLYAGITKNTNGSNAYAVNCVIADNYCGDTQSNGASLTSSTNNYIASNGGTTASGFAAIYDGLYPVLTEGYILASGMSENIRGGVAETYFDYSDLTAIKMGYKVNENDTSITPLGNLSAPGAGKVETYYEGGMRTAGVIGASGVVPVVSYHANGGTGDAVAAQSNPKSGSGVTLAVNTLTRTGYTANGWNTKADGSGTHYDSGASVAAGTALTLYAQWAAATYIVTLDKQSGTSGSGSVTATYAAAMPSVTVPTRTGYTFNGYYDAANDGTQYYTNTGASARNWDKTEATTLYAQWMVETYTISYDLVGGSVGSANPTSYTIENADITLNNPTKDGYSFAGWTGTGLDSAMNTVTISQGSTGNRTYTATWTVNPATAPTITTQPSSLNLTYGYTDGNTLSVTATNAGDTTYNALTYQWYSNTTASNEGGTAIATDGTSASYTVPAGKSAGTTEYYYCIVTATRTDNNQTATATSNVATVTIGKADITPTVTMSGYTYGGTVSEPGIEGNVGDGAVTYYYNTTDSATGGMAWSGVTATSLNAGTYYLYAEVAETDNYNAATTDAVSFAVGAGTWTQTTASGTAMQGANGTVDLTSCLAADGSFGSPTTSDGIIDGTPSMSGGTLNFKFTDATTENATATITVPVTNATNYENYNITVTVTVTPKTAQNISFANATLTKTYGDEAFTNTPSGAQTTVSYSVTDGADVASVDASTGKVTIHKAGTATIAANAAASGTYLSASASYTLTVNKATPDVTAPTAIENLTYTGEAQALVSAGRATGGELQYKLGDDEYGTTVPTATAAGDYTVYYKVVGGDNYIDVAEASVSVTISAIKVAAPVLPAAGSFTGSKSITITCETDGAAIYYTTDGSAPTSSSTRYAAAFSISATTTVKAIAVKEGCTDSDVASATYTHYTPSYDDSGSSSSSSSSTTTTPSTTATTTNADGSTTRSTSRTTTTRNSDGSTTAKTTETATTTAADGAKTEAKTEISITSKTTNGTTTATTSTTETTTTMAADGTKSTTETTENKTVSTTTGASGTVSGTGTVSATAVTTAADGSISTTVTEGVITVSTDEAGTVSTVTDATATTTDSAGNVTVTETVATEAVAKDGSTGETVVDKATDELLSGEVVISQQALDTAIGAGEPIQAPVTIPVSAAAASDASPISVRIPAFERSGRSVAQLPTVELQVTRGGFGAVAFQKLAGGVLRVIKECRMGSVIVPVEGDCELVIVDNSRDFLDVSENAWYKDSVDFVVSRSIFGGVSPRMFAPDTAMTRGMIAQVLYNFDRSAEAGAGNTFVDVSAGDWYVDAVGWANANGVITGYKVPAETAPWPMGFGPSDALTREQLVTILYRYAAFAGYDTSFASTLTDWTDADRVSDYARDAMDWALYNDIIGGIEGALSPTASATRAQVATIMMRYVSNVR